MPLIWQIEMSVSSNRNLAVHINCFGCHYISRIVLLHYGLLLYPLVLFPHLYSVVFIFNFE